MSLKKLGPALVFLAGAIVGGLALAFLAVFFRPGLLLRAPLPAPAAATAPRPAPGSAAGAALTTGGAAVALPNSAAGAAQHSLAAAVRRAAPAVVNIYTARVVTEQVRPNSFEQMFGQYGRRRAPYGRRE